MWGTKVPGKLTPGFAMNELRSSVIGPSGSNKVDAAQDSAAVFFAAESNVSHELTELGMYGTPDYDRPRTIRENPTALSL